MIFVVLCSCWWSITMVRVTRGGWSATRPLIKWMPRRVVTWQLWVMHRRRYLMHNITRRSPTILISIIYVHCYLQDLRLCTVMKLRARIVRLDSSYNYGLTSWTIWGRKKTVTVLAFSSMMFPTLHVIQLMYLIFILSDSNEEYVCTMIKGNW